MCCHMALRYALCSLTPRPAWRGLTGAGRRGAAEAVGVVKRLGFRPRRS